AYSEYLDWSSPRLRVRVKAGPVVERVWHLLGDEKTLGPWVLSLPRDRLDFFCEEVFRWDGCSTRMNHYASARSTNADWVPAVLLLSGMRANVRVYDGSRWKARHLSHQVDVTHRDYSLTTNAQVTRSSAREPVYCVSVPSGFILVRRNGKACVTGN